MKLAQLFFGLILGGTLGAAITNHFSYAPQTDRNIVSSEKPVNKGNWNWPDSLDAIEAAPNNHKVVYEDSSVRVLAVVLNGRQAEPIHTHKWKSIMWIAKAITPCQINNFRQDASGKLIKSDSVLIQEMPLNMGQLIGPEGPTSIQNLGRENGVAYRVEFKKNFQP